MSGKRNDLPDGDYGEVCRPGAAGVGTLPLVVARLFFRNSSPPAISAGPGLRPEQSGSAFMKGISGSYPEGYVKRQTLPTAPGELFNNSGTET
jgi:hypothetical protein